MEEAADTDIMEDMYRGYENLTDEEILLDIKEHNNKVALDYLINKYRNFVRAKRVRISSSVQIARTSSRKA